MHRQLPGQSWSIIMQSMQMTAPAVPQELVPDLARWGELTVDICRRFGTPLAEEEQLTHYFLISLHSD